MAFRASALPWLLAAGLAPTAAGATPARESPYDVVEQLARVLVLIEHDYVEPVDRRRLGDGAIKGMVAALDPHSAYLPPDDYAIFQSDTEGRFGGIGVEVDFADGAVTVIAPIEGSPAERAGVRPGDRIIAIGNVPVRGKSSDELVRSMRGAPGTTVLITVRREGDAKLKYFRLTREIIEVASISEKLLEQNVGYIRIKQFQSGTHTELLDAIARLRKASGGPLVGVLLDMRNNPGGLVSEATAVADEMLDRGVLFTTRHRDRVVDTVSASRGGALRRGPLVVLVNEYSASAAELVAGALQDHRRATIVGTKTFGKGSVQSILDLPGGAGIRLTSMRYYTPNGRAIQAHGVDPDVRVEAGVLPDRSFGVVREADLDNHLPAEGSSADPSTPAEESSTHLGVARDVPKDPTGGSDIALSVAFQIATGVLLRR